MGASSRATLREPQNKAASEPAKGASLIIAAAARDRTTGAHSRERGEKRPKVDGCWAPSGLRGQAWRGGACRTLLRPQLWARAGAFPRSQLPPTALPRCALARGKTDRGFVWLFCYQTQEPSGRTKRRSHHCSVHGGQTMAGRGMRGRVLFPDGPCRLAMSCGVARPAASNGLAGGDAPRAGTPSRMLRDNFRAN